MNMYKSYSLYETTDYWRIEAFTDDGACTIIQFAGYDAERQAREYAEWKYPNCKNGGDNR